MADNRQIESVPWNTSDGKTTKASAEVENGRQWVRDESVAGIWELKSGNQVEARIYASLYKDRVDLYIDEANDSFKKDSYGRIQDPQMDTALSSLRSKIEQSLGIKASSEVEQVRSAELNVESKAKATSRLTNQEIVAEVRELHSHFKELSEQYATAAPSQRNYIREEMAPIIDRERSLREEYAGRASQELTRDRVPAELSYGRQG